MRDDFSRALWELKSSINKVFLLETFLESCIVFLVAYLLISIAGFLSGITTDIILGGAAVFFVVKSLMNALLDKVDLTGLHYRDLYEELLTARDHPRTDNRVVADLHSEAVHHMGKIEEAAFFNARSVALKTIAIIALCGIVLLTAPLNLQQVPAVKQAAQDIAKQRITLSFATPQNIQGSGPAGKGTVPVNGTLFGNKTEATNGTDVAKFEVPTSNFEVNVREQAAATPPQNFDSVFPTEIGTPDPSLYGENIPKAQQELVKNYFQITAEG